MKTKWYAEGIQFECQSSGNCCTSHGEYGQVYLTSEDCKSAAQSLDLKTDEFKKKYCHRVDGHLALIDNPLGPECLFLKEKKCSIYSGRPTQCRTWPFWPDVMNAKKWKKHIETFCPGINKGRLYTKEEIDEIQSTQKKSETQIVMEKLKVR